VHRQTRTAQEGVLVTLQLTDSPAVDAVLATASSLLGMEVVFVGGLTDETFTFERVLSRADWPGVAPGRRSDRQDALCHQLLAGAPARTTDAPNDASYGPAANCSSLGIRSYVGVPVRDETGRAVATLCGIDRGVVEVGDTALEVLTRLADVLTAHLGPGTSDELVIKRSREGGWAVGEHETGDLTSAMVLADLIAGEVAPGTRPPRPDAPLDEVAQLRMSVQQLEHALVARVVVEQAIGVLTERQHSTPRQAFERLRKVARSRGRKVHDLSREVVQSALDPSVPLPPELAGHR
jgi:hypothetical protein